uniref:PCI domain-containing protein n=1 Tax=Panagrolaimus sp. JU765 TaxID=591449 RepID=A0AC34RHX3_9BILA
MSPSAGNNPGHYIATVKKFDGFGNPEEMTKMTAYIIKSCEEFVSSENLSGLSKILNEIQLSTFPAPFLGALSAKLSLSNKYNLDELQNLIIRVMALPEDLTKFVGDPSLAVFYFPVLKALGDAVINKRCPMLAIKPIADGIFWWTNGNPKHLTPAHASLLCCCLKARHFRFCMNFLEIDAYSLLKEGLVERTMIQPLMVCGTEPVLLYFYYGSLIHAVQENYVEALNFLEYLISMRNMGQSAIVIEAFKKAILFSLILGQKKLCLPGCRMLKYLLHQPQVRPYLDLAYIITVAPKSFDVSILVSEYLEKNKQKPGSGAISKDNNFGLVEILMEKLRERRIISLPTTFTAIEKKQAMIRTFYNDTEAFDNDIRKLISQGLLKGNIDQEKGILYFPQDDDSAAANEDYKLDESLVKVANYSKILREVSNVLKLASRTKRGTPSQFPL